MPDLDVRHWEMLLEKEQEDERAAAASATAAATFADIATATTATVHRNGCPPLPENLTTCKTASRIPVGIVAAYYEDYVRRKNLDGYFRCDTIVTSVRPVATTNDDTCGDFGWAVEGFERRTGKRFRYRCKRAVLATGTTDFSNHLGISGEQTETEWVTHNLNDLEVRLDELVGEQGDEMNERPKPVLVIGAGLSAADAIMAARFRGVPVLHAFRDSTNEWSKQNSEKPNFGYDRLQWLPSSMYPEYHKVYEMMADGGSNYPLYKSLPGYSLVSLSRSNSNIQSHDERMVVLCSPDGQLHAFDVSIVAILIGYKPDLSYLDSKGIGLGKYPDKPIDGKSNPIEVDNITYEVVRAPRKGLYALGTLVGDNFVRFTLGGAFGILVHILNSPMITA